MATKTDDAAPKPFIQEAPVCIFPHTVSSYVILVLLTLQATVCLNEAPLYPEQLRAVVQPVQQWLLQFFRNQHSLRLFFYCTVLVHALEAFYALTLIRRALRGRFGGWRSLQWALQTTVIGFPSLILLMRTLADLDHHRYPDPHSD